MWKEGRKQNVGSVSIQRRPQTLLVHAKWMVYLAKRLALAQHFIQASPHHKLLLPVFLRFPHFFLPLHKYLSLSVPLWMRGSVTTGSVYKVQRLIMAVERPLYIKITLFYPLLETYSKTNHIKHITYRTRLYATSRPSKTMQRMV